MNYFDRKAKLLESLKSLKDVAKHKLNVDDLDGFEKELEDLNFNVLCVGEFNAGKSTFINNFFLENKIKLPVKATPTTAKLTIVKYGKELKALAVMKDGSRKEIKKNIEESLKSMVAANGTQLEDIQYVEIKLPSEILKEGVVIYDLPGLNDEDKSRTDITHYYLEQADCILYFINALQPYSNSQKIFIEKKIFGKKDLDKTFFIINHWDNVPENERDDILSHINNETKKSIEVARKKLEIDSLEEPPLIPISAKTGENFDELKTELFASYLGNKKAQDILERKIEKYNNYITTYLGVIERKTALLNKGKEQIKLEQEQQELELKGNQLQIKENEKYIVREVANKYDEFIEKIQPLFKKVVRKFEEEMEKNKEKIKTKEHFEEFYKRSLKKAENHLIDDMNYEKKRFKRNIKDIFDKQKSDLNISFNKVIDETYLEAKILSTSAYLNSRNEQTEQLAAGLGILATLASGGIGSTLLISSATAGTSGIFGSAWAALSTFVAGTAGMSGLALAGTMVAPLAVAGIAGYFIIKGQSEKKFRQDVGNAIEDLANTLQDNYNKKLKEMQEAEDTVSEIIAENISNELVGLYQQKVDEYNEIANMQNNDYDAKNDFKALGKEISSLKII